MTQGWTGTQGWTVRVLVGGAVALAGGGIASDAQAVPAFTAPALAAGSQYLVMFSTADQTLSNSSSISYYDSFAATEASGNSLGITNWSALISTASVSAVTSFTNGCAAAACLTTPIYNVQGTEIASSLSAFLAGPISGPVLDQNGNALTSFIWTGSNNDGSINSYYAGSGSTMVGNGQNFSSPFAEAFPGSSVSSYPILAISDLQAVAATGVPEPASMSLLVVAGGATLAARRRRANRDRQAKLAA